MDASGEGNFEKGKNQIILRECDVEHIVNTYNNYKNDINFTGEDKYSYVATLNEIKENDYNLNIPRYVDTFEEEELIDIEEVKNNVANIEAELAGMNSKYVDSIIALSHFGKEYIKKRFSIKEEKISVIYNFVGEHPEAKKYCNFKKENRTYTRG